MRRQSGKVEFFRNWKNYTAGFGDLNDEFWLGMFISVQTWQIANIALSMDVQMCIDMVKF